ncbi:MAG: energy transducer TonB [bacterium]
MELSDSFKKYLLYSVSLHALVLILLLLFGSAPLPPPPPQTQVTMIRLSRGTGDLNAPLFSKPGAAEKPAPAQPASPPAPPIPVAKPAPVAPVKAPPPAAKPFPPAPPPAQAVHLGQEKPKHAPVKPAPATPAKPAPPAAAQPPSPDEQKMNEALSQIQTELKDREAPPAPNKPGTPGSPGGTGGASVPAFGDPNGVVGAADPGYAQYQSSVRSKIIREWVRASSTPDGEQAIRARIQVRINASGQVISKNVVRSSGNESFDLSALRAIERASPLPPPPEGIKEEALSEGFVVDFSSRMLGRR